MAVPHEGRHSILIASPLTFSDPNAGPYFRNISTTLGILNEINKRRATSIAPRLTSTICDGTHEKPTVPETDRTIDTAPVTVDARNMTHAFTTAKIVKHPANAGWPITRSPIPNDYRLTRLRQAW